MKVFYLNRENSFWRIHIRNLVFRWTQAVQIMSLEEKRFRVEAETIWQVLTRNTKPTGAKFSTQEAFAWKQSRILQIISANNADEFLFIESFYFRFSKKLEFAKCI